MVRIGIMRAAYDAIAATLPLGSVGYETKRTETGKVSIWLERRALYRLAAAPGEGTARSSLGWPRSKRRAPESRGVDRVRSDDSHTEQRNPATSRARWKGVQR